MSSIVSIFLNSCTWEQQQPRIMSLEKVGYSCYNSKSFSFTFKASWSHGCKLTCKIREINSESNLCSEAHTNFKFRLKNKMLVKNCGRQIWLLKRCLKLQGLCLMGRRWKKERCVKGEHQVINPDERNLLGHVLIFQHVLPHCPPALSFSLKTEVVLPMPLFCMSSEQKWQQKWQRCPQVLFWTSVGIVSWRKLTERLGIEVVLFLLVCFCQWSLQTEQILSEFPAFVSLDVCGYAKNLFQQKCGVGCCPFSHCRTNKLMSDFIADSASSANTLSGYIDGLTCLKREGSAWRLWGKSPSCNLFNV